MAYTFLGLNGCPPQWSVDENCTVFLVHRSPLHQNIASSSWPEGSH